MAAAVSAVAQKDASIPRIHFRTFTPLARNATI
jgi:hypothetical protein